MVASIILFLIVLAALIASHEFGHFIVAKWSGMRVDEFALGFPPKIWSKKIGETKYSLNLIPFGGFVKIFGEDPTEDIKRSADYARSFSARPKVYQAMVLLAGVLCNLLLAWFLFAVSFMSGLPISTGFFGDRLWPDAKLVITGTLKGAPAALAGVPVGAQVVALQAAPAGDKIDNPTIEQFQAFIADRAGQAIAFSYLDQPEFALIDGAMVKTVTVVPTDGVVAGKAAIGVSLDTVVLIKESFYRAPLTAVWFTARMTGYTAEALWRFGGQLFDGAGREAALAQVTGPIGLVGLVGEAGKMGLVYLLTFTALISINLAVINIIPFPALDGGRLLFLAIEAIIRRPLKPIVANTANLIGFVLLMFLMIAVTIKDVVSLW